MKLKIQASCVALSPESIDSASKSLPKLFQNYTKLLAETHLGAMRKRHLHEEFEKSHLTASAILERHRDEICQPCSIYKGRLVSNVARMARLFEKVFIGSTFPSKNETILPDSISFFYIFEQKISVKIPKSMQAYLD